MARDIFRDGEGTRNLRRKTLETKPQQEIIIPAIVVDGRGRRWIITPEDLQDPRRDFKETPSSDGRVDPYKLGFRRLG